LENSRRGVLDGKIDKNQGLLRKVAKNPEILTIAKGLERDLLGGLCVVTFSGTNH
jgi:hypothetical protein